MTGAATARWPSASCDLSWKPSEDAPLWPTSHIQRSVDLERACRAAIPNDAQLILEGRRMAGNQSVEPPKFGDVYPLGVVSSTQYR